jgi:hypothetical protein
MARADAAPQLAWTDGPARRRTERTRECVSTARASGYDTPWATPASRNGAFSMAARGSPLVPHTQAMPADRSDVTRLPPRLRKIRVSHAGSASAGIRWGHNTEAKRLITKAIERSKEVGVTHKAVAPGERHCRTPRRNGPAMRGRRWCVQLTSAAAPMIER